MTTKKANMTLDDRVAKLEQDADRLRGRVLQLERATRIMGREFEKGHLSEEGAKRWAKRANSFSNAMREIRGHLKKYGNEFDRAPHFTDPEEDYRD